MTIKPNTTVTLRGGLTARIRVTDIKGSKRPIGGYIDHGDHEEYQSWYSNGRAWDIGPSDYDLVMPEPERKSRWLNWYGPNGFGADYETREEADLKTGSLRAHVLEIIMENGEPVDVKIHKVER